LPAFFDVTVTNTNSPVTEGDVLSVDYSANNTGDVQDTQDIRLEIDSVEEDRDSNVTLEGGVSTTGTLQWDTTNENATTYTATVLSNDDTDSVTVEVEPAIPDSVDDQWRLASGSGTTYANEIGTETFSGSGPSWVSGAGAGGYHLDFVASESDYALNQTSSYWNVETFSWALWFNPSTDGHLINLSNDGGSSANYIILTGSDLVSWTDGEIGIWQNDADGGSNITISTSYNSSAWNFVGVSANNDSQTTLYHATAGDSDLTVVGSQNYDQGLKYTPGSLSWACRFDDSSGSPQGSFYGGGLDNVFHGNGVALSQSDMEQIFDATRGDY
jgi:hypothetical protein